MPTLGAWITVAAYAQDAATFVPRDTSIVDRGVSLVGIVALLGLCWLSSENRAAVKWRPVAWGMALQLLIALVILSPTLSGWFYAGVNAGMGKLLGFTAEGASFVFGSIEPHEAVVGSPAAIVAGQGEHKLILGAVSPGVKTFAFWILPTIVFFSTLTNVLYHIGVMTLVVRGIAWVMVRTLGTSGAESLCAAANIFLGQTEAPLLIRPFVPTMTRSELAAVMVAGFATAAGGVMGAYVGFLSGVPNIAGHLVITSIMGAPAALVCAKLIVPETAKSETAGDVDIRFQNTASNVVEAAAAGAADGVRLAINVAGMLIAFVALVAMVNWAISFVPLTRCADGWTGGYACAVGEAHALGLSDILAVLFAPLALAMGIPMSESLTVGQLLGDKMVLTEFIAFIHLGDMVHGATPVLSERSVIIASYALCGFANFASIGIQLGGIGGLAPARMSEFASLGFRAMWAATLASCLRGAIAGLFL
ncbi:MAG: nucleoside transporter C-terminal domain-containing protein [Myxococcota bacterium]